MLINSLLTSEAAVGFTLEFKLFFQASYAA
jgi:hypothetical protein